MLPVSSLLVLTLALLEKGPSWGSCGVSRHRLRGRRWCPICAWEGCLLPRGLLQARWIPQLPCLTSRFRFCVSFFHFRVINIQRECCSKGAPVFSAHKGGVKTTSSSLVGPRHVQTGTRALTREARPTLGPPLHALFLFLDKPFGGSSWPFKFMHYTCRFQGSIPDLRSRHRAHGSLRRAEVEG